MAIYKSTYCSPFLTSIDPRVTLTRDDLTTAPVEYLQCKVDSSNKNVTGYRVRILDGQNNEIFPGDDSTIISPISELQLPSLGYEVRGTNSGINGTFLKIPFFQNNKFRVGYNDLKKAGEPGNSSYQAIYFDSDIMVDHLIYTGSSDGEAALPSNWDFLDAECTKLIYWKSFVSENFNVKIVEDPEVYQKFMLDSGATFFFVEGSEQPDPEEYTKMVENRLTIGDEEILEGEIIGVVDTSEMPTTDTWYKAKTSFYKVTKELVLDSTNKTMGIMTVLEKFSEKVCSSLGLEAGDSESYVRVCIRKGLLQHLITKQVKVKAGSAYELEDKTNEWSSLRWEGSKTLDFAHAAYKWEITLYQGTGTVSVDGKASEITYDTAPDSDFDIIVATGTICGSNAKRVQIANQDPFDASGEPAWGTVLPSQTDGVLVLQGTYAALGQNNNSSFAGSNSIYVKTYDSSYGHAYLTETEVTSSQIENAEYIQFFKHSTDPAQILDSDIVDWGVSSNVELMVVDTKTGAKYSPGTESSVSVANRILIINSWTGTVSNLTSGQTVLLTGQTSKMTNGVYSYYTSGDYHCLKRAASYTSWSNYIGKIIYVQYGDLAGKNIQSLAGAGGSYSLWNPSTGTSGSSELWLAQEEPIILFGSKLSPHNVEACVSDSSILKSTNPIAAGVDFSKFDDSADHYLLVIGESTLFEWTGGAWESTGPHVSNLDYYYVRGGENHAGKVMKAGMETYELSSAKIMHNTSNFTFISPSTSVQPGMRMKMGSSGGAYYLPIKYFDSTTSAISHPGEGVGLTPLSSRSVDAFSYEILSNFKTSDENPFYCEYAPYLIIYKNGKVFNSLALIQGDEDNVVEQACYVTARSVKLSAQYINFQNVSWESYRWVLRDSEGNIKQDSGKKYDKTIETTFYGLFNDDEGDVDYYASIYIEDETGNTVGGTFKLVVIQGSAVSAQVPFSAEYIPNLQAIKLSYRDNGLFAPSLRSNVYMTDHEFIDGEELFDDSVYYSDQGSPLGESAVLTHQKKNSAPPIYYLPSTIYLEDDAIAQSDAESYAEKKLGKTEKFGLNYYRRLSNSETEMEADASRNFVLYPTTDSSGRSHTELYFETEFELGGNFQGQILSFDVQGEDSGSVKEPCVYEDGTTQDKTGYLTFVLSNGDGESSYGWYGKDQPINRNRFVLSIQKDGESSLSKTGDSLSLFRAEKVMYYLQPAAAINDDYLPKDEDKYGGTEFLKEESREDKLYFINHNGKLFKPAFGCVIGNCCLFRKDLSGYNKLSYWVEEQPVLGAPLTDGAVTDFYTQRYLKARDSYSSGGVQCWPDSSSSNYSEKDYVWGEDFLEKDPGPGEASWSEISDETLGGYCTAMAPVKRHPEIEFAEKKYRFICRISNIEALYAGLSSAEIISTGSESDAVEEWKIGENMVITIKQLSKNNS